MQTRSSYFALAIIIGVTAMTASATTIQDIVNNGGSITIGHFTFSDFSVQATAVGGISPLADMINILFSEDETGSVSLHFHGAWSAGPLDWSVITSNIGYKVTVDEDFVAESIDVTAISSSLVGDAFYLMNVGVFDGDPADPNSDAVAEYLLQEGLNEDVTGDWQVFDVPLQEFYVNTGLYLRTEENGAVVVLSEFAQTFNGSIVAIPEPVTLSLLATGGVMLFFKRFR